MLCRLKGRFPPSAAFLVRPLWLTRNNQWEFFNSAAQAACSAICVLSRRGIATRGRRCRTAAQWQPVVLRNGTAARDGVKCPWWTEPDNGQLIDHTAAKRIAGRVPDG